MTKPVFDLKESFRIVTSRTFELANTLLKNRHPQFFNEDKEYTYISADDEHWTIKHIMRDFDKGERDEEEREGVYLSGWKRYEDLGLTVTLEDYDGVAFLGIDIKPSCRNNKSTCN